MYICICRAVTEEAVKRAIDGGASTVEAVTRACCAGDDCGACHGVIEELIEDRAAGPGPRKLPVLGERAA